MQSLLFSPLPENCFEPREKPLSYAEKPRSDCPKRFEICHTYRVFDRDTPSRCSLVRPVTLCGETLTSMDHYAEGPGEFTWWTIWRM